MKFNRIFAALLALLLCLGFLPLQAQAETIATGTCGESVIWELSDQGVLTISGTGPMDNFSDYSNPVPWKEHMDAITALVIKPGITYIGAHSFEYHKNLKTVDLPTGMSEIGAAAFSGGRILTSRENKEAFSERFEEELNQVLARRENQER